MSRPLDIVLIVLDTQRADRFSCYGYPLETTPYMDQFAQNAIRFTNAISTAQWTLPAHASVFTGLYPSEHTMKQLDSVLPANIMTLAERLQRVGYFTSVFSNNPLIGAKKNGLQRGFQEISNYNSLGYGLWVSHLEDPTVGHTLLGKYRYQFRRKLAYLLGIGEGKSANWLSSIIGPFIDNGLKFTGGSKSHNAKRSLDDALKLLINRKKVSPEQPIFTFINLMGTHVPYAPPRWAVKYFLSEALGKESMYSLVHRMSGIGLDVNNWLETNLSEEEYRATLDGVYDAEVAAQDACIGSFIQQLGQAKRLEQTMVIIVSDHGDHLGEKQRISHLFGAYQELVRVPLIIHDPTSGIPKGDRIDDFVSIRRLFHTILTTARAATADETKLSLSLDILNSQPEYNLAFVEADTPTWVLKRMEKQHPGLVAYKGYNKPVKAVYVGDYKLITKGGDLAELYNVRHDPTETQELSNALPDRLAQLKQEIHKFAKKLTPVASPVTQLEDDALILSRLRDLGYLE